LKYKLIFPESYLKKAKKFLEKHPELVERYKKTLKLLELNPNHPSLRLHKLEGRLKNYYSISLSINYRLIITFAKTERGIIFIDIGSHDVYE
jgi:proteic killer suppression protein